LIDQIKKWAK